MSYPSRTETDILQGHCRFLQGPLRSFFHFKAKSLEDIHFGWTRVHTLFQAPIISGSGACRRRIMGRMAASMTTAFLFTLYPFISMHPGYKVGANDYYWTLDYSDPSMASQVFVWVMLLVEYALPLAIVCGAYITIANRLRRSSSNTVSLIRSPTPPPNHQAAEKSHHIITLGTIFSTTF